MATVTGYTAERMKQIEDETVVGGTIVGDDLILLRRDGETLVAGEVKGEKGDDGPPGGVVGGYTEPVNDRGEISGAVGLNFANYNVWRISPTGPITISFSNLPPAGTCAPGTLIVANSFHSITWPSNARFNKGSAPVLIGLTYISLFARGGSVDVGTAWQEVV